MQYQVDEFDFEVGGRPFRAIVEHDADSGPPWEREDGHGPVSDWTTRDKRPGERVLNSDGRSRRFYDFAAAVQKARAEGWGTLGPYDLKTVRTETGEWQARGEARGRAPIVAVSGDINEATRAVFAAHRATFPSARAYAAAAAESDFARLRDWCNDSWHYVGVIVQAVDADGDTFGPTDSLWGIESDAGDYIREVARELAEPMARDMNDAAARDLGASRPDLYPAA